MSARVTPSVFDSHFAFASEFVNRFAFHLETGFVKEFQSNSKSALNLLSLSAWTIGIAMGSRSSSK